MSVDGSGDRRPDETRGRRPVRQRPGRRRGPRVALLPQLLAAAVERDPAAPAVVFEDRTLSYGELDSASSRLARLLIRRGIGPEDVVAVAATRSIESVLSVWAVAKAGAAFVPVDPNYPEDRVRHMVDDSGARAGLTLTASVPDLPGSVPWIALDSAETRAALAEQSAAPVALDDRVRTLRAEHPAYVIYTSGSTGRPKGVVVTHTGLEGFCAEQVERYALTPASRTLHFASPQLRRVRPRVAARRRCGLHYGHRPTVRVRRRGPRGAAAQPAGHPRLRHARGAGVRRPGRAGHPRDGGRGRRGVPAGPGRAMGTRPPILQRLRTHRDHHHDQHLARAAARRAGHDRPGNPRNDRARAGRATQPGPGRSRGGSCISKAPASPAATIDAPR